MIIRSGKAQSCTCAFWASADSHTQAFVDLQLHRCQLSFRGAAEATAQHLLVTGEVVGAFDGLDLEAAVLAVLGPTCLKDDHRANGVCALRVGDVVTFDALWRRGQIEGQLYLLQGQLRLLAVGQPFDALLCQHLLRVLFDHFNQAQLLAALRFVRWSARPCAAL